MQEDVEHGNPELPELPEPHNISTAIRLRNAYDISANIILLVQDIILAANVAATSQQPIPAGDLLAFTKIVLRQAGRITIHIGDNCRDGANLEIDIESLYDPNDLDAADDVHIFERVLSLVMPYTSRLDDIKDVRFTSFYALAATYIDELAVTFLLDV